MRGRAKDAPRDATGAYKPVVPVDDEVVAGSAQEPPQDAPELDQGEVLARAGKSILRGVQALQETLDAKVRELRGLPANKRPQGERRIAVLALQLRRLTSGLAEGSTPPDDGRIRLID